MAAEYCAAAALWRNASKISTGRWIAIRFGPAWAETQMDRL
jgi:hypothetical protein